MNIGDLEVGAEYAVVLEPSPGLTFERMRAREEFGTPGSACPTRWRAQAVRVPVVDPITGTYLRSGVRFVNDIGATLECHARYAVGTWSEIERQMTRSQQILQRKHAAISDAANSLGLTLSFRATLNGYEMLLEGILRRDLEAAMLASRDTQRRTEVERVLALLDHVQRGRALSWREPTLVSGEMDYLVQREVDAPFDLKSPPYACVGLDAERAIAVLRAVATSRGHQITIDPLAAHLRAARNGVAGAVERYRSALAAEIVSRTPRRIVELREVPARDWNDFCAEHELVVFETVVGRLWLDLERRCWRVRHDGALAPDLRSSEESGLWSDLGRPPTLAAQQRLLTLPRDEVETWVLERLRAQAARAGAACHGASGRDESGARWSDVRDTARPRRTVSLR